VRTFNLDLEVREGERDEEQVRSDRQGHDAAPILREVLSSRFQRRYHQYSMQGGIFLYGEASRPVRAAVRGRRDRAPRLWEEAHDGVLAVRETRGKSLEQM
jgi:hypothetical protein